MNKQEEHLETSYTLHETPNFHLKATHFVPDSHKVLNGALVS